MLTPVYAAVLDQVRGITWPARRRTRSAMVGAHLSRKLGASAEFVEYRGYRQGDDPKRIDWKLLARTDRAYIRLSQERTLLPTVVVVDASASLAFPAPSLAKWELARHLAVGLAEVARQSGDQVGLVVAAEGTPHRVAPSARRSVLEEMMRTLDLTPAGRPSVAAGVRGALRRAARVVVISDFLDETETLLAVGRTFAVSGGEVYALHVVDRGELDPDPNVLLVEDPEAAGVRRPMSRATRPTYLERFAAWRLQLARDWRAAGAVYAMVVTGREPLRHTVRRITARAVVTGTAG